MGALLESPVLAAPQADFDHMPAAHTIKPVWLQGSAVAKQQSTVRNDPLPMSMAEVPKSTDPAPGGFDAEASAVSSLLSGPRPPGRGRRSKVDELNASLSSFRTLRISSEVPEFQSRGAGRPPESDELSSFMDGRSAATDDDEFGGSRSFGCSVGRLGGGAHLKEGLGGYSVPTAGVESGLLSQCRAPAVPAMAPTLPSGSRLRLSLLSTWGDPNYVGLSGLELHDEHGDPIIVDRPKEQVRAVPSGVHELPGLTDDPRTVDKLFDDALATTVLERGSPIDTPAVTPGSGAFAPCWVWAARCSVVLVRFRILAGCEPHVACPVHAGPAA